MNILIRTDASSLIGTGHVMRCLTLAQKLRQHNAQVTFICRQHQGHINYIIEQQNFNFITLPVIKSNVTLSHYEQWLTTSQQHDALECIEQISQHYDWIIVDHYAIDATWHNLLRPHCHKIMVIDDLANRPHDCNVLLDQNYINKSQRYQNLVSPLTTQLLGPKYALLRNEFTPQKTHKQSKNINNILIYFGGNDIHNLTVMALKALSSPDLLYLHIDVVITQSHPFLSDIEGHIKSLKNVYLHIQIDNMQQLMQQADLAIGAGGSTTWERLCVGLPSIVITLADNQIALTQQLHHDNFINWIGKSGAINSDIIYQAIKTSIKNSALLTQQAQQGQLLVDGLGAEKVSRILLQKTLTINILSDQNTWMNAFIKPFIKTIQQLGHRVHWIHQVDDVPTGDCCFLLSCSTIISPKILAKNKNNIVAHASDLPAGKGMSPLSWQILDQQNSILITLFEADESLDSGPIYLQKTMLFEGHELLNELQAIMAKYIIKLCTQFIQHYPNSIHSSRKQHGKESFFATRTAKDSRLNPQLSINQQFPLLRIVDNDHYPAFFEHLGQHYTLKIEKTKLKKDIPQQTISIGGISIGRDHPPFIVAEMSGNHNQSLERALSMVDAAAQAGAHAIKLQTLTADSITLNIKNGDFLIKDESSLWNGRCLHDLYQQAQTPWEWHQPIMQRAKELGLICFSSPFDESAVDFLEELDVPAYKIASFENNHLPLIKKAASTGKPLLISTGMASKEELQEAVDTARQAGCTQLILLKCNSSYPATAEQSHLSTIADLRHSFQCEIGLSDHSMGLTVPIVAVAQGATIIEKHFTLSRADGGVDAAFSLEPDELRSLVNESYKAWLSLGEVNYKKTASEEKSSIFRRSLYVSEDMQAGDKFDQHNLRIIRPGFGLAPKLYHQIIGRTVTQHVPKGTALGWHLVKGGQMK